MLNCLLFHDKMTLKHLHVTFMELQAEQVPSDYDPIRGNPMHCQVHFILKEDEKHSQSE